MRAAGLAAALAAAAAVLAPAPAPTPGQLSLCWLARPRRFFAPAGEGLVATHPELVRLGNPAETFAARKPPGTYRIFCVGGSTTRGWPFHERASYPRRLALYLRDALPGRRVEVLNAGFMRSDSWSDRALVAELLDYQPDAILLYEGRNEKWNYPLHSGLAGPLLSLHAALLRGVGLYALAANRLDRRPQIGDRVDAARRALGGARPPEEARVLAALGANLDAAAALARARACRLILLTQVMAPGPDDSVLSGVNPWLRAYARERGLELIDVDAAFERRRAELTVPPPAAHPDLEGYAVLARAAARGLARLGVAAPSRAWRLDRLRVEAAYEPSLGLEPGYVARTYCRLGRLYGALGARHAARRYLGRAGGEACEAAP